MIAYGIGIWIILQAGINMGVNLGAFPTKGLTLPFMSYGGSSVLLLSIALAIVFRVDYETRYHPREPKEEVDEKEPEDEPEQKQSKRKTSKTRRVSPSRGVAGS